MVGPLVSQAGLFVVPSTVQPVSLPLFLPFPPFLRRSLMAFRPSDKILLLAELAPLNIPYVPVSLNVERRSSCEGTQARFLEDHLPGPTLLPCRCLIFREGNCLCLGGGCTRLTRSPGPLLPLLLQAPLFAT